MAASRETTDQLQQAAEIAQRLTANICGIVRGKEEEVKLVLTALACNGHVLLEDVPGTAKTVLARAIAGSVRGATTQRVQCTPDLQPTDVTGLSIFNQRSREFEFRPGPIFANVILIDEINRAMPKTQSALFEAMAERQVTVDGETHQLAAPFFLIATENPIESEGTFPLPEAQLDRFFLRTALGYPSKEDEFQIIRSQRHSHPLADLRPAISVAELKTMQQAVEEVFIAEILQRWIVSLTSATREMPEIIELGASVRGSLALERAARAWALLSGRREVTPDDIERLFCFTIGHRVLFNAHHVAAMRKVSREETMTDFWNRCLERAPRPALR